MPIAPEIIIGAIACILCSISGAACLFMNNAKGPGAHMGNPGLDLEEIAVMQAARIEQLEAYIQRERRAAAAQTLNGNVVLRGVAAGSQQPPPQSPAPSPDSPQAGVAQTAVLIPQPGYAAFGTHTPPVMMPYVPRHQLRNYPYAGARIL
jgi:hypothetical protein